MTHAAWATRFRHGADRWAHACIWLGLFRLSLDFNPMKGRTAHFKVGSVGFRVTW